MAKKIFKYKLETTGIQQIEMPHGAEILCIKTQNDEPYMWALVSPNAPTEKRSFEIFGTGHNVPENATRTYIGTYQLKNGQLVFHCFELIKLEYIK